MKMRLEKKTFFILILHLFFLFSLFAEETHLKEFSNFLPVLKKVETSKKQFLTNLKGKKFSLYTFSVEGKENGYFILDEDEVVEEIKFTPLQFELYKEGCKKLAEKCAGKGRTISEPQILYLGPTFFLYRFTIFVSGKNIGTLTIDPIRLAVVDGSLRSDRNRAIFQEKHSMTGVSQYIKNFPRLNYYLSDMATSLGMIFTFWEKKGYPNLRTYKQDKNRKEIDEELIAEINKACESCLESSAVELFAASRGYRFKTKTITLSNEALALLEKEILADRPVLINLQSYGIVHYGVLTGIHETSSGIFGIVYLPVKNNPTEILFINLLSRNIHLVFTLINPF